MKKILVFIFALGAFQISAQEKFKEVKKDRIKNIENDFIIRLK